jgi:hypothetical protein
MYNGEIYNYKLFGTALNIGAGGQTTILELVKQ